MRRSDRKQILAMTAGVVGMLGGLVAAGTVLMPQPGEPAVVAVVAGDVPETNTAGPALSVSSRDVLENAAMANNAIVVLPGAQARPQTVDLTPRFGEEVDTDPDRRTDKISANVTKVETVLAQANAGHPRDLLGVLHAAGRAAEAHTVGEVIVVASPLTQVDPVDMTAIGLLGRTPQVIADDVEEAGWLPALDGLVVRLDLLEPAGDQEALTPPVRAWLQDLWTEIAQRAGAAEVVLSWVPAQPGVGGDGASTIPMPKVTTDPGQGCTFDAAFAFTVNTATLRDRAAVETSITECVKALRLQPGQKLNVLGHTSYDPNSGPNQGMDLSRERAQVIADLLVQAGVPRELITTKGVGPHQPIAQPPENPENRVVTVTIVN